MINYTFYEVKDLGRFLDAVTYEFKDNHVKLSEFRNCRHGEDVKIQKDLTDHIDSMPDGALSQLKMLIKNSSRSKVKSIEELREQMFALDILSAKLEKATSFKEAFEIIIQANEPQPQP